MRFDLLGPMAVTHRGDPVTIGPRKQRIVLATLLCSPNAPVPMERLFEALWSGEPPRTARKTLQGYVVQLRAVVAPGAQIAHHPVGYTIGIDAPCLDTVRFRRLAAAGMHALREGDAHAAAEILRRCLDLWRGPAFADLRAVPLLADEAERYEARRVAVVEALLDAELHRNRPEDALDSAEAFAHLYPLRERLQGLRMLALYRCGLQAEALGVFDRLRQALSAQLRPRPTPALEHLYGQILDGATDITYSTISES